VVEPHVKSYRTKVNVSNAISWVEKRLGMLGEPAILIDLGKVSAARSVSVSALIAP
jgi:hypothetical protein